MRVVAMGRGARAKANLKVRQPLAAVRIKTRNAAEAMNVERLADLVRDELNVKRVEVVEDEGSLVSYSLKPNLKTLGPRLGADLNRVRQLLESVDAGQVVDAFRTQSILDLDEFQLERDDVLVSTQDQAGLSAVAEAGYVVAVTTELSPELVAEGQVREVARHLQDLRKTAGLDVADRIETWIEAPASLRPALESLLDYIKDETLSTSVHFDTAPVEGASSGSLDVGGQPVRLHIRRV
jgi:isoleucyl-tRNA synthetase